jgi:osmotically-inducible protein OsmY
MLIDPQEAAMKSHIPYSIAALVAAGAISVATAQTGQADTTAAPTFAQEPVASLTPSAASDARLSEVAQALNADESLKGSKITVQLEDSGATLLTGAALTQEQVQRAGEIAAGPDGQAVVVNTMLPDRGQLQKSATPQS